MDKFRRLSRVGALTLLEMLIVVLIISILATIATGVYSGEARRARIAATADLLHQLSVAITRYEMDLGTLPPSGSAQSLPPPVAASRENGSGYLHMALVYSLSGSAQRPASALWHGPYINFQSGQVSVPSAADVNYPGMYNILDAWQNPIYYYAHQDYTAVGTNFSGGTHLFAFTRPSGANPDLPAPNPYVGMGETYYNTSTYQLYSFGPDAQTLSGSSTGGLVSNYRGTAEDDINNFGY